MTSSPEINIFLFDIDGVLLYPGGYRVALERTINYCSQAMGWGNCAPEENTTSIFEAHGITNEWDMSAICLAGLFSAAWHESPSMQFPSSVPAALAMVRENAIPTQKVDYAHLAREISNEMRPSEHPALAAPRVFSRYSSVLSSNGGRTSFVALLDEILLTTRDMHRSYTTPVFQNYALGSVHYRQIYGLDPIFEVPSMIEQHDRIVLLEENRDRLISAVRGGLLKAVLYTARPSMPPLNVLDPRHYYSPEAEMAASLAKLSELPLVGFGDMQWLARGSGIDPDSYVKPSPVHAIAAIGAALVEDQMNLMLASEFLAQSGRCRPPLNGLKGKHFHVTVFEDSATSIQSVQQAGEILTSAGIPAKISSYGIATHSEKRMRLVEIGARVFDDVNVALDGLLP